MESSNIALEIGQPPPATGPQPATVHPATRAAVAFRTLSNGRSLDLIGRYENRYQIQYARALETLQRHRKSNARATQTEEPVETKEWQ